MSDWFRTRAAMRHLDVSDLLREAYRDYYLKHRHRHG